MADVRVALSPFAASVTGDMLPSFALELILEGHPRLATSISPRNDYTTTFAALCTKNLGFNRPSW